MTPTPLKRSKNLVPLSKDHHEGLLVTWKIRQGLRFNISNSRIADFLSYAFDHHLQPHFIEEEELLFTKLQGDDELLQKATEHHKAIRTKVAELRSMAQPTTAQLEAFANLLETHVRFEERELFGHLEAQVSEAAMADIGARLEAIHENHVPLSWKDEFWVSK